MQSCLTYLMIYCLALLSPPKRFAQHSTPKVMRKPEKSRTVCISRVTNKEKSRQQLRHRRSLSPPPPSSRSRSPTPSRRNCKSLSTETSSSPRMSRSPSRSPLGRAATPSSEMMRGKSRISEINVRRHSTFGYQTNREREKMVEKIPDVRRT